MNPAFHPDASPALGDKEAAAPALIHAVPRILLSPIGLASDVSEPRPPASLHR